MMAMLTRGVGLCIALAVFPLAGWGGVENRVTGSLADAASGPVVSTVGGLYARLEVVQSDLNALLVAMGRDLPPRLGLTIRRADLREVYHASISMFRKANRLSFELRRVQEKAPLTTNGDIGLHDIAPIVTSAQRLVAATLNAHGIAPARASAQALRRDVPYSEVLATMLEINRLINQLLGRPFSPSDVFQEVTLAVGYAANVLSTTHAVRRIPVTPSFEPSKRPGDVYVKLYGVLQRVIGIARRGQMQMVELDIGRLRIESVLPGDVYDLAKLVVAELAYLHEHYKVDKPAPKTYYPGPKFPSHVYQRVALLESQVERMEALFASSAAGDGSQWQKQ